MQEKKRQNTDILVLGIGNVLLSDEGIGVHCIDAFEKKEWPKNVQLLDGGTGGFHLLSLVQEYNRIVLIDATLDDNEPGSIRLLKPKYATDFPKTLSSHDIGLKDLLESATLLGFLPEIFLIVISINDCQPVSMELSPVIKSKIPEIEELVRTTLKKMG